MRLIRFRSLALTVVQGTLALGALAACGGPKPSTYGDYTAYRPVVSINEKERPLSHFTVSLANPGYTALFYVVPGLGARLVYPIDSATSVQMAAGTHQLVGRFPRAINRDSVIAAQRARGGRRTPAQGTARDTTARPAGRADSTTFLAGSIFADQGYLLLVTSPAPLTYDVLRQHVEGLTIPAEDDEALNTVVKLVRATLPMGSQWAAYAKEVTLP